VLLRRVVNVCDGLSDLFHAKRLLSRGRGDLSSGL
jgi:hypothetical protein